MKVCIIGQGYIGLPTAVLFANNSCEVLGVDINPKIVENLNEGKLHIEEPGLKEKLKIAIDNKNYSASTTPEKSDVFIITVPTPSNIEDLSCDLSYVISACESIIPYLEKENIVIIESTIAPMSTDNIIKPIFEKAGFEIGKDLYLSHCPERVLPGKIMEELINNDRIVGGITPRCSDKAANVYKTFVKGKIMKTEAKTAEMSKCMENTFRDVNIALANELTKICSKIGVNALDVIDLANKHPRVNIHSPGPGVGGHCLAIDPYFIYALAPEEAKMIKLARDTNDSMPQFVVDKTKELLNDIENPKIAILGVAYKGNTGDTRESPGVIVCHLLKEEGFNIGIHDPHVDGENYCSFEEAIENADICLILSDHDEFKNLDFNLMNENMRNPIIFDTKNIVENISNNNIKIINYGNLSKL
ncbi:UDP-N-acetyl-D-glucosamine 6-dehydrogenase [Methanobrevibacter cuticularis]|uniref:UDP-N-acetyl-D-mannosamine dehydrogenase n=1 Tax=Methanobrevibacter cuticularis TaxID=47311 RepID=A0A166DWY8_9EURY|nr:nucleotide sugar dehydrogenase [Methanobrevibacter cuticularis]KZX16040.1 UDP-N-acetyl-D-glucosamine 6-dehydrogenase [Methanobrevibacter cuticularis]